MDEVKTPKKPFIYYYVIVLVVLFLFNALVMPLISSNRVIEVDYGTFMRMTDEDKVGVVSVQTNQIVFTDKEQKQVYPT